MFIDTHVHFRDGKQAYKETIAHGLQVAKAVGMSAVLHMGNGDPPITNEESLKFYLDVAQKASSIVRFFPYLMLTKDPLQITEAVRLWRKYPQVPGFKMYAGKSVGGLEIIERAHQQLVFKTLADANYLGVVVVHCEKENHIRGIYDVSKPITHCDARSAAAEIASVHDILGDAIKAGYNGRLHVAHVSCPETLELLWQHPLHEQLAAEIGPHHLLMDNSLMRAALGLYRKVNPPLRDFLRMDGLRRALVLALREGRINIYFGSDHAPHSLAEKESEPYLSGFPQLPILPLFVQKLSEWGLTPEQIDAYMFENAVRLFSPRLDSVQPRKDFSLKDALLNVQKLRTEYPYDAWVDVI